MTQQTELRCVIAYVDGLTYAADLIYHAVDRNEAEMKRKLIEAKRQEKKQDVVSLDDQSVLADMSQLICECFAASADEEGTFLLDAFMATVCKEHRNVVIWYGMHEASFTEYEVADDSQFAVIAKELKAMFDELVCKAGGEAPNLDWPMLKQEELQ